MLWHIVTFDMADVDAASRDQVEARLAGLADLDVVAWLEVARDVDTPTTTGMISLFESYADLEVYRTHPAHLPVVETIRGLGIPTSRLDVEAPLPPAATR
jgi:hypothetical protein